MESGYSKYMLEVLSQGSISKTALLIPFSDMIIASFFYTSFCQKQVRPMSRTQASSTNHALYLSRGGVRAALELERNKKKITGDRYY